MEVFWTTKADIIFEVITDSIEAQFGKKAALKFVLKVNSIVGMIEKFPFLFKSSSKFYNVRKATINKQCSLFYEINNATIYLLYFWDNRQNPID